MNFKCRCGQVSLPIPMLESPVTCSCGLTYSVSVNVNMLFSKIRDLTAEVEELRKKSL